MKRKNEWDYEWIFKLFMMFFTKFPPNGFVFAVILKRKGIMNQENILVIHVLPPADLSKRV